MNWTDFFLGYCVGQAVGAIVAMLATLLYFARKGIEK